MKSNTVYVDCLVKEMHSNSTHGLG